MKKGQTTQFANKNRLEEMIKLRRNGLAESSLSLIFNVDKSTIRYHLKKYYITHPVEVYAVERIVGKTLPNSTDPQWKVVGNERINLGRNYKDYLRLSPY